MKYRIITNGTIWKIQEKGWFFWNTLEDNHDYQLGGSKDELEFESQTEAEKYIKLITWDRV